MYIEKIFSNQEDNENLYSVILDEEELSLFSEFEERMFGTASKIGAVINPGGWNAKELAKLRSEDEEDYKNGKHRYREYIKGSFAPATATYKLHKAQKMAKEGASAKEIDEKIGKVKKRHALGEGVASALTGGLSGTVSNAAALVKGAQTKMNEDEKGMRRKFYSEEENEKKSSKSGKVGKAALIGGAGTALAGGIGENVIADKIIKKAADKHGAIKSGWGAGSRLWGLGDSAIKSSNVATRAIKMNKNFKLAKKADMIGTGIALAGAAKLGVDKLMNKKKNQD